jgi:hypothetical protein
MIRKMREDWRRFKASKPGYRFRDRYRYHQQRSRGRLYFQKALFIVAGLTIAITSIVLAPLPGPGLGTFLLGLAIIAGELRIVAHFLDWAEVKLRGPARWAKGAWASWPRWARILLGALVWIGGVAFGLWALLYVFR